MSYCSASPAKARPGCQASLNVKRGSEIELQHKQAISNLSLILKLSSMLIDTLIE